MKDRMQPKQHRRKAKVSPRRLIFVVCVAALSFHLLSTIFLAGRQKSKQVAILHLLVTAVNILWSMKERKKTMPVVSQPFEVRWEEPKSSQELFRGDTKILWGYWHTGFESLSPIYKTFLESWRVHNPDWKLIIVDESNFHQYVSVDDLPTTFRSLKVQSKSDLIRMAVLLRYGGIYMDVSTLVFKNFDHMWDTMSEDKLFLVGMGPREHNATTVNSALMMSKGIHNKALSIWRKKLSDYLENPNLLLDEIRQDPRFGRVKDSWVAADDEMLPYSALLWIMNDMLWYNEGGVVDDVLILEQRQWGFWFNSVPHYLEKRSMRGSEGSSRWLVTRHSPFETPVDLPTAWFALQCARTIAPFALSQDYAVSRFLMHHIHVLKMSNEELSLIELATSQIGLDNTMGYVYRAATDLSLFPMEQAALDNAVMPTSIEDLGLVSS